MCIYGTILISQKTKFFRQRLCKKSSVLSKIFHLRRAKTNDDSTSTTKHVYMYSRKITFSNQITGKMCTYMASFREKKLKIKNLKKTKNNTVCGQKKQPKVNECSSVANYRTAMIFFLQSSQESEVFFDGNFFCQEFVCLPFFCPFSPLEGPKRAKKHPQVDKIAILGMKRYSSTSQTL